MRRVTYFAGYECDQRPDRAGTRIESWMAGLESSDQVVTCVIVRGEILFGIARLPVGRRRLELERIAQEFLSAFYCEAVPERAADIYAEIKKTGRRRGLSLDENDLWVAATAVALGATLVSRDTDFSGIDGLPVVKRE